MSASSLHTDRQQEQEQEQQHGTKRARSRSPSPSPRPAKEAHVVADTSSRRVMTVTSTHHWHKGKKLVLAVGAADGKFKSFRCVSTDGSRDRSDDAFLAKLYTVFSWTGCGRRGLHVDNGTVDEVYTLLYAMPIPRDVRFVALSTCGCNMGHCNALLGVQEMNKVATYGAAIALWGDWNEVEQYWEYPDSVYLYLDRVVGPLKVRKSCDEPTRAGKRVLLPTDGLRYYSFSYGR